MRWWLLVVLAGCAGPVPVAPTLEGSPEAVPDPFALGSHASDLVPFDAGRLLVDGAQGKYPVQVHGEASVPDGEGPFPLVILMHGRHATCRYAPGAVGAEFLGHPCPQAAPVMEPVDSYTGYRGLAEALASHGMLVLSISANDVNDYDNPLGSLQDDYGATARGRLVLEVIRGIRDGDAAYPFAGLADVERIGLMGHSRGGEGVARAALLDQAGPRYGIDAVFALAPTDFQRWRLADVALGTIIPYCDGDVSNLQGAWMYDDAGSPKHQFLHMGANHNFYNTVWTGDDWSGTSDPYCAPGGSGASGRLSPEEQREQGYAVMATFLRHYVAGHADLWPLLEGSQPFPFDVHTSSHYELGHAQSQPIGPDTLATASGARASRCTGTACPIPRTMAAAEQVHLALPANGTFSFPVEAPGTWTYSVRIGLHPDTSPAALAGLAIVLSDADERIVWRLQEHGLFVPPGDSAAKTTLNMVWLPVEGAADGMHDAQLAITSEHAVELQFTDWYALHGPRHGPLVDAY